MGGFNFLFVVATLNHYVFIPLPFFEASMMCARDQLTSLCITISLFVLNNCALPLYFPTDIIFLCSLLKFNDVSVLDVSETGYLNPCVVMNSHVCFIFLFS